VRSSADIRERLLERLDGVLERPGMWAVAAFGTGVTVLRILDDLCFIDERDEMEAVAERLRRRFPGATYIWQIDDWFGPPRLGMQNETATILREEAVRLGYVEVRRLTEGEWARLRLDDLAWCRERDWRAGELDEWLPAPSWGRDPHRRSVYAFAPPDEDAGWVGFDFDGVKEDALLRDVRLPTEPARDGVVLTPHGRTLLGPDSPFRENAP
jgi:hypothetical protein